jgi:hypothetical protein
MLLFLKLLIILNNFFLLDHSYQLKDDFFLFERDVMQICLFPSLEGDLFTDIDDFLYCPLLLIELCKTELLC